MAKGVGFTKDSAKKIAKAVRIVEGLPPTPPGRYRSGRGWESFGRVIVGKTDASHAKGASGVISVYDGTTQGSETDTGDNVTAYNRFADVASGKWVAVVETVRGFELISAEC